MVNDGEIKNGNKFEGKTNFSKGQNDLEESHRSLVVSVLDSSPRFTPEINNESFFCYS